MAIEDGAVLAKLFSHITSVSQIENFMYAFQDLRQERVRTTRASEFGGVFFMAMPDGEHSRGRNDAFRAMRAEGKNVLDAANKQIWEEYRTVFGYDCEDEADNWWVEWGLLRQRAQSDAAPPQGGTIFNFASMMNSSVQVSESTHDAYEEHDDPQKVDAYDSASDYEDTQEVAAY